MKFISIIAIFVCWATLTTASDIFSKFPRHLDDSILQCQDNNLSVNFSNAVILEIGRDFINSPLVTCLNLANNNVEKITDGAFDKAPKLTKLYLSNNKFRTSEYLFAFGSHKNLKALFLDRTISSSASQQDVVISGDYPNLEILSVSKNGFNDLIFKRKTLYATASTTTLAPPVSPIPFNKLKILNLSGNDMIGTNFVKLLPATLNNLYLHDNSLNKLSLSGINMTTLTLDNNKMEYLRHYSNNPKSRGFHLSGLRGLRYLSIFKNKIHTVESIAFQDATNLVYLNLSMNNIDNLYPETFARLQSLETLDLSRNELQQIPGMSRETNIITLYLNFNKIKRVNENAFARMPKLRVLSLRGNEIDVVDIKGFSNLHRLEKLNLSKNKLSILTKGWTEAFGSLKYLDLSDNQFTSLMSLSLTNMLPLVEVYLALNPLTYLDAASFNTLPKNVTINLVQRPYENVALY